MRVVVAIDQERWSWQKTKRVAIGQEGGLYKKGGAEKVKGHPEEDVLRRSWESKEGL